WKEAEELEVQVMETSVRALGEEHLYTLTSMANLAFTFSFQGRKQVQGPQHPHTTSSLETLNGWQMENMGIRL
ncbi:uncharacterized protein K441DRAFT_589284, partial [Cenococcum geophilum 1.58]